MYLSDRTTVLTMVTMLYWMPKTVVSYYIRVGVIWFLIESSGIPYILNHVPIYSHKSSHLCPVGFLLHRIVFVRSYVCCIGFLMNSRILEKMKYLPDTQLPPWTFPRALAIAKNVAESSRNAGRILQTPLGTFAIWKMWPTLWIRGAFLL